MKEHKNTSKNKQEQEPPKMSMSGIRIFFWMMLLLIAGYFFFGSSAGPVETNWHTFKNTMLENHDVEKVVVVNQEIAEVHLKRESLTKERYSEVINTAFGDTVYAGPHYQFNIGSVEVFERRMEETMANFTEEQIVPITYTNRFSFSGGLLIWLFPIAIIILFWVLMTRSMRGKGNNNIFNMGKSKARVYEKENRPNVKFNDVAGLEEAKEEIQELVSFLKDRQDYTKLGAKIPKGILLVGPPGTGKTLMGKAVAGEAGVPFIYASGSDFVEMFVGVGASRVRNLFTEAKKLSPCIIFIDEIDAIGRARRKNKSMQSNDEQENTLNQMLQELDGFDTNSGVIVLAATNRQDVLDKALLRAGRFDRLIYFDLPNYNERKAIFKIHIKGLKLAENIDIGLLASQTPGFSGADIANLCNEAALIAARNKKESVEQVDFMEAMDRTIAGLERRSRIIPDHEKKVIAYHEAGHAVISKVLDKVENLVKVSIIPRGRSLGANWYREEERQLHSQSQLLNKMCAALGGRAAEEIKFGETTSGALDDLEKVTKMAYAMVTQYGFNEKIGNISFYDSQGQWQETLGKPYSEHLGRMIDEEVRNLIGNQYERAKEIVSSYMEQLDSIAGLLLEKEIVYAKDLEPMFKKMSGKSFEPKEPINYNMKSDQP
jgi:AFG3 family protein